MTTNKIFTKEDVTKFLLESVSKGLITVAESNSFIFKSIGNDLVCISFGKYLANTTFQRKLTLTKEQKENVLNFSLLMKKEYEYSNVKVVIRF